jgi:hypothetical protein
MYMVRNFGILKIALLIPTRSDQYRTGPSDVSFTSKATRSIRILERNKRKTDNTTSKRRFISS